MIVDDPTRLKEWLITELNNETIDADPQAVALYAVALVKKDVSEGDLKPAICNDLAVFLQENTESFVDRLFQALRDKSYIQPPSQDTTDAPTTAAAPPTSNGPLPLTSQVSTDTIISKQEIKSQDSDNELSDDDRDHRRTVKRSRSRSRSRSPGSSHQPRHRVSPHRRLGFNRGGFRGGQGYHSRGMRRGGPRDRPGPGYHGNFGANRRHDGGGGPLSRRRSRSPRRSLSPRRRTRSRSPRRSMSPRRSHSPVRRSRSPLDLLATLDVKPSSSKRDVKQRCRDYDEKGFCLQGDMCPYSHGNDAVVMTDVAGLKLGAATITPAVPTANPAPTVPVVANQQPVPVRQQLMPPMQAPGKVK